MSDSTCGHVYGDGLTANERGRRDNQYLFIVTAIDYLFVIKRIRKVAVLHGTDDMTKNTSSCFKLFY